MKFTLVVLFLLFYACNGEEDYQEYYSEEEEDEFVPVKINDPDMLAALHSQERKINYSSKHYKNVVRIRHVQDASKRVDSGEAYYKITFYLDETTCLKRKTKNIKKCTNYTESHCCRIELLVKRGEISIKSLICSVNF